MTISTTLQTATDAVSISSLPLGAWDLVSFFTNAKNYGTILGGGFVSLIGLVLVVVAVFQAAKNFLGNGQGNKSWVLIVFMFILGGALLGGSIAFVLNIAAGGQTTIEDLGGGFIIAPGLIGLGR